MTRTDLPPYNATHIAKSSPPGRLLRRIAFIALLDGGIAVFFGLGSVVLGVLCRDVTGVWVGLAVAACGGIELRGRAMALATDPRAGAWLGGSQIGVMLVVLAFCGRNLLWPPAWSSNLSPDVQWLLDANPAADAVLFNEMLPAMLQIVYLVVILASLMCQGGLCFYYSLATRKLANLPPPLPDELQKF